MIAADQHFRRRHAAKLRGPRVMRIIEQSPGSAGTVRALGFRFPRRRKTLLLGRRFIAQGARQQPRDRVHDHGRAQLSAAQHVIADRNLAVRQSFGHALVHAFIAPADQDHALESRKFLGHGLREHLALRGKQDHARLCGPSYALVSRGHIQRLHALEQRLRLEHHAFAPAERTIVHRAMLVGGEVPQIVHRDFNEPGFARAAHDAVIQRPAKKVRKNRDDFELHRRTLLKTLFSRE